MVEGALHDTMASMAELYCKNYKESEGAVPLDKIHTMVGRLVEAKNRGASLELSPRFDFRHSPYKKSLTSGVDVILKETGKAELISILASKKYSANEAPAIAPEAILLKVLMFLNHAPFISNVKYSLITAGSPSALGS